MVAIKRSKRPKSKARSRRRISKRRTLRRYRASQRIEVPLDVKRKFFEGAHNAGNTTVDAKNAHSLFDTYHKGTKWAPERKGDVFKLSRNDLTTLAFVDDDLGKSNVRIGLIETSGKNVSFVTTLMNSENFVPPGPKAARDSDS